MSKIPTAKLILTGKETYDSEYPTVSKYDALEAMIEFAKLHVEAALKEAEKETVKHISKTILELNMYNKNSILNAYPLENIK